VIPRVTRPARKAAPRLLAATGQDRLDLVHDGVHARDDRTIRLGRREIDALDSGRVAGWTRTGKSFAVFPSLAAGNGTANPVCRILIPPPTNSHFFSASPSECAAALASFPGLQKETDNAYYIALPVTSGPNIGACPTGTIPVYRVFRKGNHRYTTDRAIRDQMVAISGPGEGAEGYGPDLVIMCAPPAAGGSSQAAGPPSSDDTPPYMPPPGYGYGQ